MALLQNISDNIAAVGNNQEEEIKKMESPKKAEVDPLKTNEEDREIATMETEEIPEKKSEEAGDKIEKDISRTPSKEASSVEESTAIESAGKKQSPVKESPGRKSPVKKDNKKDENQENVGEAAEQEEDEEEDEKSEQKKGIFDMPLEVEGKRERHKVERISIGTPTVKKAPSEMKMGNGVPLGEIAYIDDQLKKHSADELQVMHRLIYGHIGKASIIRREIRKFTGFAFAEDTPEFKHKVAFLQKLTMDQLKILKKILGLQSGANTKEALVTTIMVFMMKTVDHERKVPTKKRKSTAKTPSTAKRQRKSKGLDDTVEDDDEEEEEEEKEKEKEKEKTPKKTPKKPASARKPRKKKESESKEATLKMESENDPEPAKNKSRKITKKSSDDDTSSNTSEETPQENNPSEKDLEDVIEELLSTFDLAQVSMKQMCQAVIERFPGTTIGNRVDFLKSKIKQALSTK
ncbi:hypothetical protein RB195_007788 [Necator americanus]|uniref:DEK-C domain-containing protein n=1 Tax=Necator americanus TaxID=51031 RepID=A0ABR1C1L9_NECAM